MIAAIHQPPYLPWLPLLAKISQADVFILLDTVQFESSALNWTNRNYVKTASGPVLLTVPIKRSGLLTSTIADVLIDNGQPWRRKHLKTIQQAYSRAPAFAELFPLLEAIYSVETRRLADWNADHLDFWLDWFEIDTVCIRASDLAIRPDLHATALLVDICRAVGATTYLSGPNGRDYLAVEQFDAARIKLEWQFYEHPVYPQLHGHFVPRLGVVDAAMNGVSHV